MNRGAKAALDRGDTVTPHTAATGLPALAAPGSAVRALRRPTAGSG